MKKILGKNFVIFLSLVFVSCSAKNEQQTKIRIVDLQGKSHPVATKIPDLNVQALVSQGRLQDEQSNFQNPAYESQQNVAPKNIPAAVAETEQLPQPIQAIKQAPQQPSASNIAVNAGAVQGEQAVEYDLSESEAVETPSSKKKLKARGAKKSVEIVDESKASKKVVATAPKTGKFFVQVGSFSSMDNANKTLSAMKKFNRGEVETVDGDKVIYRVLLGPFANRVQATAMVKKITTSGHPAILVKN